MTKTTIALAITLSLGVFGFSQEEETQKKFDISLTTGNFLSGELDTSHNFTIGVQGKYFFKHQNKFHHFANIGFARDLNTEGVNFTAVDLGIGTQYDLFNIGKQPLFITGNLAALYYNETFAVELINGTVESSFDEFGFKAYFGIGYQISKRFGVEIGLTQFNTNGTTAGLSFTYNF